VNIPLVRGFGNCGDFTAADSKCFYQVHFGLTLLSSFGGARRDLQILKILSVRAWLWAICAGLITKTFLALAWRCVNFTNL
jgi:hypothetical protein